MLDLEIIKEKYQEMDTDDLIRLSKKHNDLREDAIPILISELKKRGKKQDAENLLNNEVNQTELNYQNWSMNEIQQMVEERIKSGEKIDSIKIDLKENGIDIFQVLKDEIQIKDEIYDKITLMKENGISHSEIDEHLNKTYSIEKTEASKIKSDLKIKGKRNESIGFILIAISSIFILILISGGNDYIGIKRCLFIFIAGFTLFIRGKKQSKE